MSKHKSNAKQKKKTDFQIFLQKNAKKLKYFSFSGPFSLFIVLILYNISVYSPVNSDNKNIEYTFIDFNLFKINVSCRWSLSVNKFTPSFIIISRCILCFEINKRKTPLRWKTMKIEMHPFSRFFLNVLQAVGFYKLSGKGCWTCSNRTWDDGLE